MFIEWFNIWGATALFAQACSQVSGFGGKIHFGGKEFYFIVCLKQIFLGTTELMGSAPACLYVATRLARVTDDYVVLIILVQL